MGKNCHREIEKVSSPVISVVIPVFNAEEFIELAIESVMVQPVSEVEEKSQMRSADSMQKNS